MQNPKPGGTAGPLSGIKVVDLSRALSGPICTMIMADMGAEVVKVEQPSSGGAERENQPGGADMAEAFDYLQRNKKSVTLNIHSDKGKDILKRFIQWGDILVENYRPGFMKKIGFDYPEVHKINPKIIHVSISGYGQTGPYSQRAGMDTIGQAMGGLMSLNGAPDAPPINIGSAVSDTTAGMFGTMGALLALQARHTTGRGQHVDSSLMESIVFINQWMLALLISGKAIDKGREEYLRERPGDGTFRTQDGSYIVIMSREEKHWPRMAEIINRPDFATSPGYRTRLERSEHFEEIQETVESWIASHSISEVEIALDKAGIPFGRVQTLPEVLVDPHLKSRNMFFNMEYEGKSIPLYAPYPILSDTPGTIRTPWPRLGQHNEETYGKVLGISAQEIANLQTEGVI